MRTNYWGAPSEQTCELFVRRAGSPDKTWFSFAPDTEEGLAALRQFVGRLSLVSVVDLEGVDPVPARVAAPHAEGAPCSTILRALDLLRPLVSR